MATLVPASHTKEPELRGDRHPRWSRGQEAGRDRSDLFRRYQGLASVGGSHPAPIGLP